MTSSAAPGGARTCHVALGTNPPKTARLQLGQAAGSAARGSALLDGSGIGSSPDPSISVTVKLSGLAPGSVDAAQILLGVCGAAPAPTTGFIPSQLFVPPAYTLNNLTAGPDGTATSTTVLTEPPNPNGPAQVAIPAPAGSSTLPRARLRTTTRPQRRAAMWSGCYDRYQCAGR